MLTPEQIGKLATYVQKACSLPVPDIDPDAESTPMVEGQMENWEDLLSDLIGMDDLFPMTYKELNHNNPMLVDALVANFED